jgi:hypothetical protein
LATDKARTRRNEVQTNIISGIGHLVIHEGNIEAYLNKENSQQKDRIDLFTNTKCNPDVVMSKDASRWRCKIQSGEKN